MGVERHLPIQGNSLALNSRLLQLLCVLLGYLCIFQSGPLGIYVKVESVCCAIQSHSSYQQDCQHDVREGGSEVHDLKNYNLL